METSAEDQLPSGLIIPPMVLPFTEVNLNQLRVPIHNETSRDISLQPGTVIAQVYSIDTVAVAQGSKNIPTTINPELFNFGNSSVPEE